MPNTPSIASHLTVPPLFFPSMHADSARVSTRAWSVTTDAHGNHTFYPERTGVDELRACVSYHSYSLLASLWPSLMTMVTQLPAAVRGGPRAIFLPGSIRLQETHTQVNSTAETGTGTIPSLLRTATAEGTRTRTAMTAATGMAIMIPSLSRTVEAEETHLGASTTAVIGIGVIQGHLLVTLCEARTPGPTTGTGSGLETTDPPEPATQVRRALAVGFLR